MNIQEQAAIPNTSNIQDSQASKISDELKLAFQNINENTKRIRQLDGRLTLFDGLTEDNTKPHTSFSKESLYGIHIQIGRNHCYTKLYISMCNILVDMKCAHTMRGFVLLFNCIQNYNILY